MTQYIGLYNYWVVIFLMMTGFYIVIARSNLIQKVIGLNIFQISVFLLYITMGKVTGGTAPILPYHHDHHTEAARHELARHELARHELAKPGTADDLQAVVAEHDDVLPEHPANEGEAGEPSTDVTPVHRESDHDDAAHGDAEQETLYTHPLPSVLMLTAIVVGVATTSLALALVIRIGEAYGTIEEDEILQRDRDDS